MTVFRAPSEGYDSGRQVSRYPIIHPSQPERSKAMKKWRCTVCGYVHAGDNPPEKCPVCGAGKAKFKELA